jgi:F-type H+-transporting ATPase subunit a
MAAGGLHISISAEKLFSIGRLNFTNSMLTSVIASGLLIAFALWVRASLKKTNRPTGVQNVAEWIVESLVGLVQSVTNNTQKTEEFFPLVATFFLFVLLNNWLGLLPGSGTIGFYEKEEHAQVEVQKAPLAQAMEVQAKEAAQTVEQAGQTGAVKEEKPVEHAAPAAKEEAHAEASNEHKIFVPLFRAGTADLNTTLALGLISVIAVQIFGIKHQHLSYFKKFINFSNPIQTFVGILEIVSEFSRIVSFAFRLFGNVFAGEVLLAVIGFLVPVIAPMPFYGLEIFVGFIQALVFAMLSVVLYNMATIGHSDH